MKLLTLEDLITSSGKYPERANSPELTAELKANGADLVKRINNLLKDIYTIDVKVSSGFRPSSVNSTILNAAKRSLHMTLKACDISDPQGKLRDILLKNVDEKSNSSDDVLTKYGLWLENPQATKGWIHLDAGVRTPRKRKVFNP